MAVRIAIVEDEIAAIQTLEQFLARFSKENGTQFHIRTYQNPILLLENYSADAVHERHGGRPPPAHAG